MLITTHILTNVKRFINNGEVSSEVTPKAIFIYGKTKARYWLSPEHQKLFLAAVKKEQDIVNSIANQESDAPSAVKLICETLLAEQKQAWAMYYNRHKDFGAPKNLLKKVGRAGYSPSFTSILNQRDKVDLAPRFKIKAPRQDRGFLSVSMTIDHYRALSDMSDACGCTLEEVIMSNAPNITRIHANRKGERIKVSIPMSRRNINNLYKICESAQCSPVALIESIFFQPTHNEETD